MLIDSSDQTITTTFVQRHGKKVFDALVDGSQDKYVVMRDNKPAVVMLSIREYERILDQLDELEKLQSSGNKS